MHAYICSFTGRIAFPRPFWGLYPTADNSEWGWGGGGGQEREQEKRRGGEGERVGEKVCPCVHVYKCVYLCDLG